MVSISDWWAGLSNYNHVIFPIQLIVMAIEAALIFFLLLRPGKASSTCMKIFLSLSMMFTGVMFFIVLGGRLPSPLKYIQGALFIIIGMLFLLDVFKAWSELSFPSKGVQRNISFVLLSLVMLYPVIGLLRGHDYTKLIYPGTLPCGSTAFALIFLAGSLPKTNKIAYVLLLIWAIPFAPLIQIPQYKVYEDVIMFVVGIYALVRLLQSNRNKKTAKRGIVKA